MSKKFEIGQIVSQSWDLVTGNLVFWLITALIYVVLSGGLNLGQENIQNPIIAGSFGIAGIILSIVLTVGIIKLALIQIDGQKTELEELFTNYKKAWHYFLASLLVGLIVFAGFILLIVPGIIWALKYQFVPYLIVDKNLGILEAMRESSRITTGFKWRLFLFNLLTGLINMAGMLALGVGLLLTMPITWVAQAKAYRVLS